MQATLSLLQTTTTTTKKRSRRQRTVSPGFHAVFICGTAYPGSEQQTRFLKPCQLSLGIWQSWPLLLFTLAQTFSPSPCCAASSPPPAASGGEAPSMGNVRAKCHRLRSPLIYGPFTPRGEILSHVIFGSWSAEDELHMQVPSRTTVFVPKTTRGKSGNILGYQFIHHAATLVRRSQRCCFGSVCSRAELGTRTVGAKRG